jgi:hypothetical protein
MKPNQNNFLPILAGILTTLLCLGIAGGTIYFGVLYFQNRTVVEIPESVPATLEQVKAECANGECIEGCVAKAAQAVGDGIYPTAMDPGTESLLVAYKVDGNELLEPSYHSASAKLIVYQRNNSAHHRIWDYFTGVVPLEQRPGLDEFDIYAGGESGAQFSPTEDGGWILRFNVLASTDSNYLTEALVHEYGHFISLNPTQQMKLKPGEKCKQEPLYDCPAPDSYVNQFFEEFWRPIYREWGGTRNDASRNYQFYLKHSDQFVSAYAASQPLEDIAETWTAFIIQPKPTGDTIADQKVLFFYQFPELVELRYELMYGICNYEPPKK